MNTRTYLLLILTTLSRAREPELTIGGSCTASQHFPDQLERELQIPGYFVRNNGQNQTWITIRLRNESSTCDTTIGHPFTLSWNATNVQSRASSNATQSSRRYFHAVEANISISTHFSTDGTFFNGTFYFDPEKDYCVESYGKEHLKLILCPPNPDTEIFVPKCCARDEFIYRRRQCTPVNNTQPFWKPDLYTERNIRGLKINPNEKHVRYYIGDLTSKCSPVGRPGEPLFDYWSTTPMSADDDPNRIKLVFNETGAVVPFIFENSTREWRSRNLNYCVDGTYYRTSDSTSNLTTIYRGEPDDLVVYFCRSEHQFQSRRQPIKTLVHTVAITISCVFLLATVIVYLILFKEHNLHGLLVLGYSVSLLGRNIFSAFAYFISIYPYPDYFGVFSRAWPCVLIALLAHYLEIASYLCMSVLNVDTLLTLRSNEVVASKGRQLGKFASYMLFAWGIPFIFIVAFFYVDTLYRDPYTEVAVPGYGDKQCYVARPFRGYYVYLPMAVIMGINLLLIISLIYTLWRAQRRQNKVFKSDTETNMSGGINLGVWLLVRVFIVMGGSELVGFLSWYYHEPHPKGEKAVWLLVLEAVNYLSPVLLFFLFCFTKRIRKKLRKNFRSLCSKG